jgi:hypothetical protein
MATFNNDLRLKEIVTGAESGTWGTSTNTNLSLVADAFSLGTKNMAADADQTFTMPDASADGVRSLYLKITSAVSLTATRTVTLAPNTVSKVWIIENATTGSQIITIAQGSGATVNVPNGSKLMVVTDGAGGGAAVFNANPTTTVGTVTSVGGTGTVNGITLTGTVTSSGNLTLGGTLANVSLTTQVTGTLPVANGGTGITSFGAGVATWLGTPSSANLAAAVTDETGSGALVFATSPTLVTPALGTPASGVLTNATGLPISTGVSGLGSGVATFLATPSSTNLAAAVTGETGTGALVFATSPTLVTPALGTPSALVGTNITGTAAGLTAGNVTTNANLTGAVTSTGNATVLGSFTSANLAGALTDETGTGSAVFANSPTLVTPALGTPSALVGTNITGTAAGLTAGNVTTNANLTGAITSTGNATSLGSFTSANLRGALTDETGTGAAVFATSPTLVTPILGTPQSGVATNLTGLPLTTGVTGTLPVANGGTGITSFGAGVATWLGTPSSANLAAAVTDETGTGALVFATSPTLVTPVLGTPTSGTLSGCTVDGTNAVGFRTLPQVSQSAAYTLVLTDSGKHIFHPSADTTARTFTIPANSSVAFPIGTAITFINQNGAGVITIAITTDTMRLAGVGTTGSRTLAANGIATCVKITATEWIISGTGLT